MANLDFGIPLDRPFTEVLRHIQTCSGARGVRLYHYGPEGPLQITFYGHPLESPPRDVVEDVLSSGSPKLVRSSSDASVSMLCAPVLLNGKVAFALYLEEPNSEVDPIPCLQEALTHLDGALSHDHAKSLMADSTERKQQVVELTRERDQLEDLVRERTAELEATQKELVRKERLATLGQLIATVSHELRNPLGTVRGSVFLIANRLLGKDLGVERALDRAERNIVRCDRIIEDLLDYTRTHNLELEPILIDRWLENTLEEYQFPDQTSVRLELNAPVRLDIEPERFRRCLVNLLNNACDAMLPPKGERRKGLLTISSRQTEDRLEVSITDTGPGISQTELEKIFEPLYSTKSFGVGLGLPTVQQIMEQHNGGLEITSKVGTGTKATLWFPWNKAMAQDQNK